MSQKPPTGREVKPVWRHVIRDEWFRTFTLWERLRIALGFSLLVYIRIPCRHNPHSHKPIVGGCTSWHHTPDAHLIDLMEQAVSDSGEFSGVPDTTFADPLNPKSQSAEHKPD